MLGLGLVVIRVTDLAFFCCLLYLAVGGGESYVAGGEEGGMVAVQSGLAAVCKGICEGYENQS